MSSPSLVASRPATLEELDALYRARLDQYCYNTVKIKNSQDPRAKVGSLVPFVWNVEQHYVHERIEQQKRETGKVRVLILKPRQRGISTYVASRFYQNTTFNEGQNTYILTHEEKATQTLFEIAYRMHTHMVPEYRPRTIQDSKKGLTFAVIDSKYSLGTAGTKATGRSSNIQNFHGSEVGYWPNDEDNAAASMEAVPDAPGTEIILESTANGLTGYFYDQWVLAEAGKSDFLAIFFPWFWSASLRRAIPEGYEFELSEEEQEVRDLYDLELEQMYWAHFKNIQLGGDPGYFCPKFKQEYPANAQEAFQASGLNTLIPSALYMKARKTVIDHQDFAPIVIGMDSARGGDDRTRIVDRQGRKLGGNVNLVLNEDDEMVLADYAALVIKELIPYGLKKFYIDLYGKGIHDRLLQKGYSDYVVGVDFGSKATEPRRFMNKRAEIWWRLFQWLKTPGGVDCPDDDEFHRHICAPQYKHVNETRIKLEAKQLIKERLKFSPDAGDAAALTLTEILIEPDEDQLPEWMHRVGEGNRSWMSR